MRLEDFARMVRSLGKLAAAVHRAEYLISRPSAVLPCRTTPHSSFFSSCASPLPIGRCKVVPWAAVAAGRLRAPPT